MNESTSGRSYLRTVLAVFIVLQAGAVPLHAWLSHEIVRVVNVAGAGDPYEPGFSPITHHTIDVLVICDPDDDWCASGVDAELFTGTFFQSTLGGDVPADADILELSPATEFDTYYSGPGDEIGFAMPPDDTPTSLDADYFDTIRIDGSVHSTVRMTIVLPEAYVAMPYHIRYGDPTDMPAGLLVGFVRVQSAPASSGGALQDDDFFVFAVCRGDLNADGVIDLHDLLQLIGAYGRDGGGDLDGDGDTDLSDLAWLLALLHEDEDGDGVPDGCDLCPDGDDAIDSDGDFVADDCDGCEGYDDAVDTDDDGVPDLCELEQCGLARLVSESTVDSLGYSVAVSGTVAVVGAPMDNDLHYQGGAAHVYRWNGTAWTHEAKLVAPDGQPYDRFGVGVAIQDDRIAVGATGHDYAGVHSAGAVYLFEHDGQDWIPTATLGVSDPVYANRLGVQVAIDADAIAVLSLEYHAYSGSVYVFRHQGATWIEEQKIEGHFECMDLSGNVLATGRDFDGLQVYRHDDSGWTWEASLNKNGPGGSLGVQRNGVSLHGDVLLAGAPDTGYDAGPGAAYVFEFDGAQWIQTASLLSPGDRSRDYFGYSVALDGDTALVTASGRSTSLLHQVGSIFIFDRVGDEWVQRAELPAPLFDDYGSFGYDLDLDNGLLAASTGKFLWQTSGGGWDSAVYLLSVGGEDCNENDRPDWCDIADGTSTDADGDGVPDECEPGNQSAIK